MTDQDDASRATLEKLLQEHGFEGDTRLYRETTPESLTPTGTPGVFRLKANASPSEAVVDVYGQGYLVQAEQVGPGLAFAESPSPNWQETMEMRALKSHHGGTIDPLSIPMEVEVRLGDILKQGGRLYPVESVTVERVWYCTLPADSVDVRPVMQ